MELNDLMPDGYVLPARKYLGSKWESAYLADNDITADEDVKQIHKDFLDRYTVEVQFDFSGVSVQEMADQLVSTTSFSKMLYNNELKHWTQEEAEEKCKVPFECKIRSMMDTRKSRALSPEEAAKRAFKKMRDKGMTKEQILEMLEDL